jgi:hypothetical protein
VLGISKVSNLKQFWNAPCSITLKLGFDTIDKRLIHPQNAFLPIVRSDCERMTLVMSSRFLNAFAGIFRTPT